MLFNSFEFAIFYLVITALYFIIPHKYRWVLLLGGSCYFYMAFVPIYILILGFTIVIDYLAGIYIEQSQGKKRKLLLACSLIANIGILAFFKYYNFLNDHLSDALQNFNYQNPVPYLTILLPIGLSFHTFQAMSYTIEVYRGNHKAERRFGIYSLYVMFYPQLVAGPIERPQNILPQLHEEHKFDVNQMVNGLQLMLWGFFKKLVVADRLSIYVDAVYNNPSNHNGSSIALASFFFAIQIYCDFSGYTDIAIGCARTMGFDLMENFRRPYFSTSIKEFWSRWHISLSTWFRDYLYIPLGGNRVSASKKYFNLIIVFVVSGIWHGANTTFIIWGLLHGILLIIGQIIAPYSNYVSSKKSVNNVIRLVKITFIICLVTFCWIFFRANSLNDAITLIKGLRSIGDPLFMGDGVNSLAHCILAIFILMAVEVKKEYFRDRIQFLSSPYLTVRWVSAIAVIFAIVLFGVFSGGQFIYFQF